MNEPRIPPMLLGIVVCLGVSPVRAASPTPPADYQRIETFSANARILAARLSPGPWIDLKLAAEIETVLSRAQAMEPCLADLEVFSNYDLSSVLVSGWPSNGDDVTHTGDRDLDSLSAVFRLESVHLSVLTFERPLNTPEVAALYARSSRLRSVMVNSIPHHGDEDRVWAYPKDGVWHLAVERRPPIRRTGCADWAFWFFEFRPEGPDRLEEWKLPSGREEQNRRAKEKRTELDDEVKMAAARALEAVPRGAR